MKITNTNDTAENPEFRYKKEYIEKLVIFVPYIVNIYKKCIHQQNLTQTRSQNNHLYICLPLPNTQSFATHNIERAWLRDFMIHCHLPCSLLFV